MSFVWKLNFSAFNDRFWFEMSSGRAHIDVQQENMDTNVKAQVFVLVINPYNYRAKVVDKIDNAVRDFIRLWFCVSFLGTLS